MDQKRDESICTPINLYEVTLSMVCEEILSNGKFVLASLVKVNVKVNVDLYSASS